MAYLPDVPRNGAEEMSGEAVFAAVPAQPRKQNHQRIEYPCAVTYYREEMPNAFIGARGVSEHTRLHIEGLGYLSIGTAKGLISSLLAAVRKAEEDDQERAREAQQAAQAAGTEQES